MLPGPVSFRSRRGSPLNGYQSHRKIRDILLTRARVTNLGLILLASFAALSFLVNVHYYFSSWRSTALHIPHRSPQNILSTIDRDEALELLDHLVIVPGHAIWKGTTPEQRLIDDSWVLEPFQRGGQRVAAFFAHISQGVERTLEDERALLVFSGGQTRRISTTTEAESYMRLALSSGLFPSSSSSDSVPFLRATTEDHALDSFENLLFSIARFHEYTGHYPTRITVVGYEMKRQRFTELHRAALRWPASRFHYIGIDADGDEAVKAREGERTNGYLPYTLDAYGCHDSLLSKRRSRNPFLRYHPYYTSSPELGALFDWCPDHAEGGRTAVFKGPLPWDHIL